MVTYSLAAKFISELLASTLAIFLGCSAVANELLPSTKGHGMGYFATGLGFVIAFFFSGACFGGISAELNPAMFLYLALRGKVTWMECLTGSIADVLGAFIGGCCTYLFFAEYFWTVPLPQDPDPVSRLVNGVPDALSADAGRYASAFGDASHPNNDDNFLQELRDFGENLVGSTRNLGLGGSMRNLGGSLRNLGESRGDGGGGDDIESGSNTGNEDVIAEMEQERLKRAATMPYSYRTGTFFDLPPMGAIFEGEGTETDPSVSSTSSEDLNSGFIGKNQDSQAKVADEKEAGAQQHEKPGGLRKRNLERAKKLVKFQVPKLPRRKQKTMDSEIRDAAFEAAIRADQAAKLSVFATRPAKYNRVNNFFQEFAGTTVLIVGIQTLVLRRDMNPELQATTSPYLESFFTAFFVIACVMGLGGTTGFAVNPCRDLGPRLAHFLLPIKGKGDSEWHYGWVPVLGPLAGSCAAAAVMIGIEALYASGV